MTPLIANIDTITFLLGSAVMTVGGLVVGYVLGARYKQRYLAVARELAVFRGENFQNVPTVGIPRANAATARPANVVPTPATTDAELITARRDLASVQSECEMLRRRVQELEAQLATASEATPVALESSSLSEVSSDGSMALLREEVDLLQKQIAADQSRIHELEQLLARESELLAEAREIAAELAAESPAVVMDPPDPSGPSLLEDVELTELQEQRASLQSQLENRDEEVQSLRTQLADLDGRLAQQTQQLQSAQSHIDQLQRALQAAKDSAAASASTGTESWQLAQLHREHVSLQLQIDGHLERIRQTMVERDASRAESVQLGQQVEQLRSLLAQHEAMIASLERERDALRTRADLLEQQD